ncbi:MAG TPA: hypothetical protein DCZ49_06900 [Hyphomonadaceae bacterium]|nr:hypothetical protein [Hyphomonadaceae bacterium]
MEMQQIRYFLALARTLNFTRAAEECHISQPALTRSISALEAELGGDLIRRERALSHLTELGERMLPILQRCYDSAAAAKELAKALGTGALAPLTLGLTRTTDETFLLPALGEIARALPGLAVTIKRGSSEDLLNWLREGTCDLAIGSGLESEWSRLDSWTVDRDIHCLVLPVEDPRAGAASIAVDDLQNEKIVAIDGCAAAAELCRTLEGEIGPGKAHMVADGREALGFIRNGLGLGFLPQHLVRGEAFACVSVDGASMEWETRLYCVAGRERLPAAAALFNLLRHAAPPRPRDRTLLRSTG